MNRDISAAGNYHDGTKHSVARLRAHPHYLDWDIKPRSFKVYPNLEPIPLPRELPPSRVPALTAIAMRETAAGPTERVPDLIALARLLHFSAGIVRTKTYPGGEEHHFRAAACTGALYHIDLYVICGDLPGWQRVSITSDRTTSRCIGCAPAIIVVCSSRPRVASRRSHTRR